jgi:hypothetical protein
MNYYASEGSGGSGLGGLMDNRDMMQASPHHHPNPQVGAWFDTDL